jgi:hypothetical protein
VTRLSLPRVHGVSTPASTQPVLLVVVDTEEEFDWGAPFSRANTSVTAMRHVGRAHTIFSRYGIKPTYVMDYPVAADPNGVRPLQELFESGQCAIGAHLHPWVNPPHSELVGPTTSYTCNLSPELQAEKLRALVDVIGEQFGRPPRVFKAGRYGIGTTTANLLDQMAFHVDHSVCPAMDFTPDGGPSFVNFDAYPFFLTPTLLEFPCTVDFVGRLGRLGPTGHRLADTPSLRRLRAVGVLGRLRAVRRIMLSPEGNTVEEMCTLAQVLYDRGLRVFTLSYHSPSLVPGHTPYVRNQRDLESFLACLDEFCEFFMHELNGRTTTSEALRKEMILESHQ